MAGISIAIAADTKEFTQPVGEMPKALDKVSDALDDLARGSDKAGDKLTDSLKDAQRETQKTENYFKDLAKAEQKAGTEGSQGFSQGVRRGTAEANESIKEFKGEALQNASETFSSFQGDTQSLLDGIQGTFGGIVSSLGPLGAVAGAAGAIGIGLISAAFQTAGDNDAALKQKVQDLATEFIETGTVGSASIQGLADRIKNLATVTDGSDKNLSELKKAADDSGRSFKDLAQAYAGNTHGLKDMWRQGQDNIKQLEKQQGEVKGTIGAQRLQREELSQQIGAQKTYNDYVGQALGVQRKAAEEAKNFAKAGGPELERKAKLIENIDSAYDDAAGAADDYVDSESGIFDTDKYIKAMQSKQTALRTYQENLKTLGGELGPSATSYLESLGSDQASILLQGYKDASPAQRAALDAIWTEAGKSNSGSYNKALQDGIPKTLKGPTVTVDADTSQYDAAVRRIDGHVYRAYVDFAPRNGNRVFG